MAKEYVVVRQLGGEPTKPVALASAMAIVRKRAQRFVRPFIIFQPGRKKSTRRVRWRRRAALKLYRRRLFEAKPDEVWVLRGIRAGSVDDERRVVLVRTVEQRFDVELPAQAEGWPQIQKNLYAFVMGTFKGKVAWWGTTNCRPPRQGGAAWSDHACSDAGDFAPASMAVGDAIQAAVLKKFGSAICYIAWRVSLHFDHLHISTGRCSGCGPAGRKGC